MDLLTPKQHDILNFIGDMQSAKGASPTLKEIAQAFNVSIGTVQSHIRSLQQKAYITVQANAHRGIRVAKRRRELEVQQEWREAFDEGLGAKIRRETDPSAMVVLVRDDVRAWLGVDHAELLLYDPRARELRASEPARADAPIDTVAPQRADVSAIAHRAKADVSAAAQRAKAEGSAAGLALRRRRPVVETEGSGSRLFAEEAARRPGLKACAALPVSGRDRVLAVLRLDDLRSARRFDDDMIARASLVVTALGPALEQGGLDADLRRRVRLQTALLALCRSIASTRDVQAVMRELYGVVNGLFAAPCLIAAVKDAGGHWWLLLESDLVDGKPWLDTTPHPVDIGKNEALRALQTQPHYLKHRTPAEVRRLEAEGPAHTPDGWLPIGNVAKRSASFLYVPIKTGGRMTGYLCAQSYAFDAYSLRDAEDLGLVAEYVGLAVQTGWRQEQERARGEAAEKLLERLDRIEEEIRNLVAAQFEPRARARLEALAKEIASLRTDRQMGAGFPALPG